MTRHHILAKVVAVAIAAVTAILISGCTVPVSTTSDESKDYTRSAVSDSTVEDNVETILDSIQRVMDEEQIPLADFCSYVTMYPEEAWSAFDNGAEGFFTYQEYEQALNVMCS